MNKQDLFKVTITEPDGTVLLEVESDCIMAAFSEPASTTPDKTAIRCVNAHRCTTRTIIGTLKALDNIKQDVLKDEPALAALLAADALTKFAGKVSKRRDDDTEE